MAVTGRVSAQKQHLAVKRRQSSWPHAFTLPAPLRGVLVPSVVELGAFAPCAGELRAVIRLAENRVSLWRRVTGVGAGGRAAAPPAARVPVEGGEASGGKTDPRSPAATARLHSSQHIALFGATVPIWEQAQQRIAVAAVAGPDWHK